MLVKVDLPQTRNLHQSIVPAMVALTVSALTACGSVSPVVPKGFEQDPLTIVRVLTEALNAKQFDGALSFFADDVAFTSVAGDTRTGKASVLAWMKTHAQQRADLCDVWLAGDTVTWTVRTSDLGTMKSQAVVQDGKIKSLQWIALGYDD